LEEATPVERFCVGTIRQVRRFTILIAGFALIAVGAVLLVLPGPGTVVIAIGLGVLGLEFAFARRWLAKSKDYAKRVGRAMTNGRGAGKPAAEERERDTTNVR
jgi:tellurite resistance protein TerC